MRIKSGPLCDFSAAIPLGAVAPRRHAPRRMYSRLVSRKPQRPCSISLPQKQGVPLDSVIMSSFACLIVFLPQLKQSPSTGVASTETARASSARAVSVARRLWPLDQSHSLGLLQDDGPCCALRSTRRLVDRAVSASRFLPLSPPKGWSRLGIRPSATDYAPSVS